MALPKQIQAQLDEVEALEKQLAQGEETTETTETIPKKPKPRIQKLI
jgi:hypothetical protein